LPAQKKNTRDGHNNNVDDAATHAPKPKHKKEVRGGSKSDNSLYESDPRAYRKVRQRQDYRAAKLEVQKRQRNEGAAAAFNLPEQPLVRTLGGGTAMIFDMAQRMFEQQQQSEAKAVAAAAVLPRWHPTAGIANENPSFRTASPDMNHQGYAGVIWRNVRKRNKASLWRYALRTYDRMGGRSSVTQGSANDWGVLQPTNIHHEGALLATAKLGWYERALEIYATVEQEGARSSRRTQRPDLSSVQATDHMVQSVVRACVRAARSAKATSSSISSRRQPLDAARTILEELEEKHGIPLDARHVNPLAAAYQAVGLRPEAATLLQLLGDRVIGPEPETGSQPLNINDFGAKDKASYALLIEGAVLDADWGAAVENLTTMTDAGLYPLDRHLHTWTEISNRKAKHRTTRSWKKKRDQTWLRTVHS
jgi:hypothetical protein